MTRTITDPAAALDGTVRVLDDRLEALYWLTKASRHDAQRRGLPPRLRDVYVEEARQHLSAARRLLLAARQQPTEGEA